eukprot:s4270_g7.t1
MAFLSGEFSGELQLHQMPRRFLKLVGLDGEKSTLADSSFILAAMHRRQHQDLDLIMPVPLMGSPEVTASAPARSSRNGTSTEAVHVVPQDTLDEMFNKVEGHSHGRRSQGQKHWDELERDEHGAVPLIPPSLIACQKGCKLRNGKDRSPNQDNFSVTQFKSGYTLVCVFDGHGPYGHIVSTRAVQTVPWFMVNDWGFNTKCVYESSIEKALIDSFQKAHADVVAYMQQQERLRGEHCQFSGSTAVAALFRGNEVWTANAGDSRCLIASEEDKSVIFQTAFHKPQMDEAGDWALRAPAQLRGTKSYSSVHSVKKCPESTNNTAPERICGLVLYSETGKVQSNALLFLHGLCFRVKVATFSRFHSDCPIFCFVHAN